MVPKIIHLCWFSDEPYPVEIKVCLESWRRVLPDYEVKIWRMADARAIGLAYVDEALDARRWAFASDVVRFYAVYTYGGVYMDSDVFIYRRFDDFIPDEGFVTFHEKIEDRQLYFGLQAAFFIGSKGNEFCRLMLDYYKNRHYINPDGSQDNTISPYTMKSIADDFGYRCEDVEQNLGILTVYPTRFLAPRKRYDIGKDTIGQHRVYGSWRKRKFGRRIEIWTKHIYNVLKYKLFNR